MTQTFGGYEVIRELGRGGMGVVYLATDTRLKRQVALKRLFQPGPAALEEARAAAGLVHPNVVTLFGIEELSGAETLLVMEFVNGTSLRTLLNEQKLTVSERLDVFAQMLDGAAAAHAIRLVHCDLKPSNVIVSTAGHAKILDFGIARLSHESTASQAPSRGTAGYMAPEQYKRQKIDCSTDVFALGAILYEILAGEAAFSGDSSTEISMRVMSEAPPRLAQLRQEARTQQLASVVEKALQKDASRRFESAIAMREAFRKACGVVSTRPPAVRKAHAIARPNKAILSRLATQPQSVLRRTRMAWRRISRRRRAVAVLLAGLVALMALTAVTLLVLDGSAMRPVTAGGRAGGAGGGGSSLSSAASAPSWNAPAYAQTPNYDEARAHVASMKSDLRNLVTAQEAYFSDNNSTYASSLASLGTMYRSSSGVTVQILASTATGWSAVAAHDQLPGLVCVISVGGTATNEGEPVCAARVP